MQLRSTHYFFILLLLPLMVISAQNSSLQEKLDLIKKDFAPDKRTVLFVYEITGQNTNTVQIKGETTSGKVFDEVKKAAQLFNAGTDHFQLLPTDSRIIHNYTGRITVSVANIRTKPEHSSELATQALMGTPVKMYKTENGWVYIQTPDEYLGWVEYKCVAASHTDSGKSVKGKVFVTAGSSLIYKDAEQTDVVSDITAGAILDYSAESITGASVVLPDGREGFIAKKDYILYNEWLISAVATQQTILKTAKLFLGFPYLWGGTSPKGMDCSGFTKTVFFLNGTILPRDASQQVYSGAPVTGSELLKGLEPGDLLYFGEPATEGKKERVTHTGIYLGNMEFIHASTFVQINSLDPAAKNYSDYRRKQYMRARRYIGWVAEAAQVTTNLFYNSR